MSEYDLVVCFKAGIDVYIISTEPFFENVLLL